MVFVTADTKVNNISDQFMFGPVFMAAPIGGVWCTQSAGLFPGTCGWYDSHTGKYMAGGNSCKMDAPYERNAALCNAQGAIVPYGPENANSDESLRKQITLYAHAGKDGEFTLYEHEGAGGGRTNRRKRSRTSIISSSHVWPKTKTNKQDVER